MKTSKSLASIFAALLLVSPVASGSAVAAEKDMEQAEHPEARLYDRAADAKAKVDAALERAKKRGTKVILAMGANWCHDSRAFAGWFSTERFSKMASENYELVYIDVGQRDRNIDIAKRFGIKKIKGTPTVLVLSADGKLLNKKTAPKWRNAASRSEQDIFEYFAKFK